MNLRLFIMMAFLPALVLQAQEPVAPTTPAPSDPSPAPALRSRLFELAGALGNEGFKVRDGCWVGRLEGGKPRLLKLNLFAGNQYWLCAATPDDVRGLKIAVYDAAGKPVTVLPHQQPGLVAAGLTAATTGQYFVELQAASGQSPDFCFTYLFK